MEYIYFTNVSFNKSDVGFGASATGKLNVFWYLEVHVNNTEGTDLQSANVSAFDNNSIRRFTTLTNSTGKTRQALLEYWQNATYKHTYSNYTVNATKGGYDPNTTEVNLSTNKQIYFTLSRDYVDSCRNLTIANSVYYMNQNISSAGTCMVIKANNITLDCQHYTINYSQSTQGYGVDLRDANHTTIRNCKIKAETPNLMSCYGIFLNYTTYNSTIQNNTIMTGPGYGPGGNNDNYGIRGFSGYHTIRNNNITTIGGDCAAIFIGSNNIIFNNTITTTGKSMGIYSPTSSYNNITFNTFSTESMAIYIYGSWVDSWYNHTIKNNIQKGEPIYYYFKNDSITIENDNNIGQLIVASSNNITIRNLTLDKDALVFVDTHNSLIENCTINVSGEYTYGISLSSSDNNTISNNNITSKRWSALDLGSNNNLASNNKITTTGPYGFGISVSGDFNNISNTIINTTNSSAHGLLVSSGANDTIVKDSTITTALGDDVYIYDYFTYTGAVNLTNVSFDKNNVTFDTSNTSTLNVFWYLDVYVNNSAGNDVPSANVSVWDNNSVYRFLTLTNSTGKTRQEVLEYWQNTNTRYTYGNYTVNASKGGYFTNTTQVNMSTNRAITLTLSRNYVDSCRNLTTENAEYYLNQSVNSSGTCFFIKAHNIILDCEGHNITWAGSSVGYGVNNSDQYDNITIQNCVFEKPEYYGETYSHAIYFNHSLNPRITNNTIVAYYAYGINLDVNCHNANISDNYIEITGWLVPLYIISSDNITLSNNNLTCYEQRSMTGNGGIAKSLKLDNSEGAELYNNRFYADWWSALDIRGNQTAHFNHTIGEDNLLNNMSIKYIAMESNKIYQDANWTNYSVSVFNTTNVSFINISLDHIFFGDEVTKSSLENSTIQSSQVTALEFYGVQNMTIRNNFINHSQNTYPIGIGVGGCTNITIINNSIQNTGNQVTIVQPQGYAHYFIYNNTINATNSGGIYMYPGMNGFPTIIEGNNIYTSGYGIQHTVLSYYDIYKKNKIVSGGAAFINDLDYYSAATKIIIMNDSILNSTGNYDIIVNNDTEGVMNLTNTTLTSNNISIGSTSNVTINVFWYMDINVSDTTGSAVSDANVTVTDINGTLVYNALSDGSGEVSRRVFQEYWRNATADGYYTNYTVNASRAGYTFNSTIVNLSTNQLVTIILSGLPLNISLNVSPNSTYENNYVDISGHLNDSSGTGLPLHALNIYLNDTQYYYNNQTGYLEANSSLSLPRTTSDGNYIFTLRVPTIPSIYIVKVNTTNGGKSAETTKNLEVKFYHINVSVNLDPNPCNSSQNVTVYGHINDSEGNNISNTSINIYINNSLINTRIIYTN
ncbi:hypothetical protein AYK26_07240 [Euryarchaeota archaeon SM23-78]|nr:MAG: hypothetical protein AYK26_07240 [Euryarchaeota archaeon SM23-78]